MDARRQAVMSRLAGLAQQRGAMRKRQAQMEQQNAGQGPVGPKGPSTRDKIASLGQYNTVTLPATLGYRAGKKMKWW